MGVHQVGSTRGDPQEGPDHGSGENSELRRRFMKRLLGDLIALERMLAEGTFETGVRRIGCEQEVVLVDQQWQPAPVGVQILNIMDHPQATTEIARFNLEFNGLPLDFKGNALSSMRSELQSLLKLAERSAGLLGVRLVLAGILPTMTLSDLGDENITPLPRYAALDVLIKELRGNEYELRIKGIDELSVVHHNLLVEALNTSFQLHWQVRPERFAAEYNAAQLVAGPVLSACTNSAVLFGKRLWRETRIAIFQQVVDTRGSLHHERESVPRVRFGERWVDKCVTEIFKADVAMFRMLFGSPEDEDSGAVLDAGGVPKLRALQMHNGTVYRWNRPCYGVLNGKPHLRIENRYLPSGPTLDDEMANAALWFGLMAALPEHAPDISQRIPFDHVTQNFVSAARIGLGAEMSWLDGRTVPARDLLLNELIPMAREGLDAHGLDRTESDRLLGIMERRVSTGRTGSQWTMSSVVEMRGRGTRAERLKCLTAGTYQRQRSGRPVSEWEPADLSESGDWEHNYLYVGQFMTTRLFTLHDDEPIDLAASIMDWEHIRHIPVEDNQHHLIGLVSYRDLLRVLARGDASSVSVGSVMKRDPQSVTPETPTLEVIRLMRESQVSCLPVVAPPDAKGMKKLVGIVTDHDVMGVAGKLLEDRLRQTDQIDRDEAKRHMVPPARSDANNPT
jgi:CBS domain-containing protein